MARPRTWSWLTVFGASGVAVVFPSVAPNEFVLHVGVIILIYVVLALSLNLIVGYTGQFAMCHAAFYGIGAYTSALLVLKAGVPFWWSWLVAVLFTGLWAVLVGYPALRLQGAYLAICTFGFSELVRLALENWRDLTNGTDGVIISYRPTPFSLPFGVTLRFETRAQLYYLALVLAVFALAVMVGLVRSRIGRVLVAIREDETLALAAGYHTMQYKLFAFVVSALFAGLMGGFYAPYMTFLLPKSFDIDETIFILMLVLIGGRATIVGPVLGSVFLVSLPYLLDVEAIYRMITYGLILIVTILYLPDGAVGLATRWRGRREALAGGTSPFDVVQETSVGSIATPPRARSGDG